MRLFELGELPKRAGAVNLHFDKECLEPTRFCEPVGTNRSAIMLRYENNAEFFPLYDGKQFIISYGTPGQQKVYYGGHTILGSDEKPFRGDVNEDHHSFLARLNRGIIEVFERGGGSLEHWLETFLMPPLVRNLQTVLNVKPKRFGFLYLVRLDIDIWNLEVVARLMEAFLSSDKACDSRKTEVSPANYADSRTDSMSEEKGGYIIPGVPEYYLNGARNTLRFVKLDKNLTCINGTVVEKRTDSSGRRLLLDGTHVVVEAEGVRDTDIFAEFKDSSDSLESEEEAETCVGS